MKISKVSLPDREMETLTSEAKELGISRSELMQRMEKQRQENLERRIRFRKQD